MQYGTPLQVVLAVVSIILLATQRWLLVWLVTGAAGAVVMGTPQVGGTGRGVSGVYQGLLDRVSEHM